MFEDPLFKLDHTKSIILQMNSKISHHAEIIVRLTPVLLGWLASWLAVVLSKLGAGAAPQTWLAAGCWLAASWLAGWLASWLAAV